MGGRKDGGGGASGRSLDGSGSGTLGGGRNAASGMATGGASSKGKGRFELARNKLANKSTDSNETTSSDGGTGFSSKGSSRSDLGGGVIGVRRSGGGGGGGGGIPSSPSRKHPSANSASSSSSSSSARSVDFALDGGSGGGRGAAAAGPSSEGAGRGGGGSLLVRQGKTEQQPQGVTTDLSRTESMSSTCSTLSIFGLPSRNHSFTYDGGESSTYSHESLEIGDSVENLQVSVLIRGVASFHGVDLHYTVDSL